jgi:GNAT superfamily N-acetyltransferase
MQVRRLSYPDLDQLLGLYAHLHVDDVPLPDRARVEATWAQALEGGHRYYGGALNGQLVCSCNLTIIPNLTRGCRPFGIVENVVTHADFRKKGFGRVILRHALNEAWQENCYKVMLQTGRKDDATLRFYEGLGFDRHGKQAFIARPAA